MYLHSVDRFSIYMVGISKHDNLNEFIAATYSEIYSGPKGLQRGMKHRLVT